MDINKGSFSLRNAIFPAIMTIISFLLFIGVYLYVTITAIEPYYLVGLVFAIPFICFGVVTYFTGIGQLKAVNSIIITIFLIIVLSIAMFIAFIFISIDAATTETTDIAKYERVMKHRGYPENLLISHFPEKIPDNARNIVFRYNPAFGMGGENFNLKFETDSESINNYIHHFSQVAKWIGKADASEAEENGILSGIFSGIGYEELPEDFTIYLIDSRSDGPVKWNHGMLSLVAISKEKNEIIFIAENW